MAKSVTYIASTASTIVGVLAFSSSSSPLKTTPTISLVKPSTSRLRATMPVPTTMNGRLRPHLDVLSSAMTPTMGWTRRPDSGPAIQTADVLLFVRPRLSRYGVQSS